MDKFELQMLVLVVGLIVLVVTVLILIEKYRTQYLKFIRVLTSWQLFVASILFIYVTNILFPEFGYTLLIISIPIYAIILALAFSQSAQRPVRWFDHKPFKLTATELDAINEKDVEGLKRIDRRQKIVYILILAVVGMIFLFKIFFQ